MDIRRKIILSLCLTLFFLAAGTAGYVLIEDYTLSEAIYMAVITITTVGYGEIHALSEAGRVFTIIFLLFGVGSLAFATHAFTESMIARASSPVRGKRVMEKKIGRLKGHTIICGHGRVGKAAADHLEESGKSFVILENSKEKSVHLRDHGFLCITGDATREKNLISAGIKSAGSLLALLNSDPDNLFTVLIARDLNPTLHIVARSESAYAESKILRAGADSIISPYASAGRRVADRIMIKARKYYPGTATDAVTLLDSQLKWIEVDEKTGLIGHAVTAAATLVGANILGIRRSGKDYLTPTPDFQLEAGDRLLVVPVDLAAVDDVPPEQPPKIVLVDDNPVIRRLYTRLFQKAGFNIITSSTGREGYKLILREQPAAAVVDYLLDDVSGLEVCEFVRASEEGQQVKLFLFTADERDEVRENAMNVGVDVVVLKSPDAAEIINLVRSEIAANEQIKSK